ncbi:winged helix DNA-binding domain-containing protein, partial [Atractiella rhizophila]
TTSKPKSAGTTKKTSKPVSKAAPEHPTYQEMILEAIEAEEGGTRNGVSRQGIKKYIETTYKIEANASTNNFIAAAIKRGEENGVFTLPKGISGKIKKAPKTSSAGKEV